MSTGGKTFCSLSARASDTPSRTSARRAALRARNGSDQTTSRAASSERSSGAPLPTRIASVLAKRAVSRRCGQPAGAGHAQQHAVPARAKRARGDYANANGDHGEQRDGREPDHPVARKKPLVAISACVSHGSVCRLCW